MHTHPVHSMIPPLVVAAQMPRPAVGVMIPLLQVGGVILPPRVGVGIPRLQVAGQRLCIQPVCPRRSPIRRVYIRQVLIPRDTRAKTARPIAGPGRCISERIRQSSGRERSDSLGLGSRSTRDFGRVNSGGVFALDRVGSTH